MKHPRPKSPDGRTLARSIRNFALNHNPPLKYKSMRTAIDSLTAGKSPNGSNYDFHYDVDYRREGVYITLKQEPGYRTFPKEVEMMRQKAGF